MSQAKTIALVVVIAVVAVGGYFWMGKGGGTEKMNTQNAESTTADTTEQSGKKMAFSEFLKQGGSYKCTVNQSVAGTETVGTTYIKDGLMKGEYNTKVAGLDVTSYFIMRDGYSYSWSSMMPTTGFKVKVDQSTEASGSTETSGSYSFNAEQIGDYSCEVWSADESVFTLPSSVTFKEV